MTSHELAHLLLQGPDLPVMVQIDPTDGTYFPMNNILVADGDTPGERTICFESTPCMPEPVPAPEPTTFKVRLSSYPPDSVAKLVNVVAVYQTDVDKAVLFAQIRAIPHPAFYIVRGVDRLYAETVAKIISKMGALCHIEPDT